MMTVSAWRSREYRRVWASGAVAGLGGEIGDLALPVLALTTLAASAQEMSWVKAALYLPYLVLTLWLGVLVDRRRRRPLMIGAELASFVVTAAAPRRKVAATSIGAQPADQCEHGDGEESSCPTRTRE